MIKTQPPLTCRERQKDRILMMAETKYEIQTERVRERSANAMEL